MLRCDVMLLFCSSSQATWVANLPMAFLFVLIAIHDGGGCPVFHLHVLQTVIIFFIHLLISFFIYLFTFFVALVFYRKKVSAVTHR